MQYVECLIKVLAVNSVIVSCSCLLITKIVTGIPSCTPVHGKNFLHSDLLFCIFNDNTGEEEVVFDMNSMCVIPKENLVGAGV